MRAGRRDTYLRAPLSVVKPVHDVQHPAGTRDGRDGDRTKDMQEVEHGVRTGKGEEGIVE